MLPESAYETHHEILHHDRLFPSDPSARSVARKLYDAVRDLPILSPHGHTDPRWFAEDGPFPDPATLFLVPDHYIYRMLYSQGIAMESVGVGQAKLENPRAAWRLFAENYYLFRGTPTRLWLDYAFQESFGMKKRLSAETADEYFDTISARLATPEFRPRALFKSFNIEVLATTDSALDNLEQHQKIRDSGWKGRVIPAFRPDAVVDPDFKGFVENVARLGEITGEDTGEWKGYLKALEMRRAFFIKMGAKATDHGHPTAATADLSETEAGNLFKRVLTGRSEPADRELFRAQMLTEMARMSLADGLVMQIHPGAVRNHNEQVFQKFGRDMGADIPAPTDYVNALRPMLSRFGNEASLTVILFTLDESTFSRELAPLAGHYPCLRLGPPWWFLDSPEGMMRFRELATETAGFYNTVGFNDDTRAFLSIPARHDVARRIDCAFLGRLVAEHRLDEDEAFEVAQDLTVNLARKSYRL
ncbi:MAG: glucuronate isomerase [Acidobacteriaceae bacterium]